MKTKENGETNKCNIQDEERLAEEVQKYPCLYGKRNEGYKEKDRKENTWREGEQRLLNCVLSAHVLTCLACLCVHVPACFSCLRAQVLTCFTCLHAHVPSC